IGADCHALYPSPEAPPRAVVLVVERPFQVILIALLQSRREVAVENIQGNRRYDFPIPETLRPAFEKTVLIFPDQVFFKDILPLFAADALFPVDPIDKDADAAIILEAD